MCVHCARERTNSCLNICFAEACLGEFHLDSYNLMTSASAPRLHSIHPYFLTPLHNTARGGVHWLLIKRQKEIRSWGCTKLLINPHQSAKVMMAQQPSTQ